MTPPPRTLPEQTSGPGATPGPLVWLYRWPGELIHHELSCVVVPRVQRPPAGAEDSNLHAVRSCRSPSRHRPRAGVLPPLPCSECLVVVVLLEHLGTSGIIDLDIDETAARRSTG